MIIAQVIKVSAKGKAVFCWVGGWYSDGRRSMR